ncbi:hypothetical protein ACFQY3_11140 [Paenibacillus farraposensis]|uniref:hypothetical protein n=1 Tax=Paenibacillus farraposensis TaxID=2807095 RepID=UPI0036185D11
MNKQQNDQPQGLRFDIYERIHLTEEAAGIAELEEIELLPRIQVVTHGDHAALRGHLLLEGVYRTPEEVKSELHHLIPVEITIPLNRVGRLEDISVEIENFDVDLLSLRSLNITGVLSLHGVESSHAEETAVWLDEEFTVVHAPEPSIPSPSTAGEYRQEEVDSAAESEPDHITESETSYQVPVQQEFASREQPSQDHTEQKLLSAQQAYEPAIDPDRLDDPWTGKAGENSPSEKSTSMLHRKYGDFSKRKHRQDVSRRYLLYLLMRFIIPCRLPPIFPRNRRPVRNRNGKRARPMILDLKRQNRCSIQPMTLFMKRSRRCAWPLAAKRTKEQTSRTRLSTPHCSNPAVR